MNGEITRAERALTRYLGVKVAVSRDTTEFSDRKVIGIYEPDLLSFIDKDEMARVEYNALDGDMSGLIFDSASDEEIGNWRASWCDGYHGGVCVVIAEMDPVKEED